MGATRYHGNAFGSLNRQRLLLDRLHFIIAPDSPGHIDVFSYFKKMPVFCK
jgi:hypothetical protein